MERREFCDVTAALGQDTPPSQPHAHAHVDCHPLDRVVLNVGGVRFETAVSTLTAYPDTLLGAMFSARSRGITHCDAKGEYFFDRCGPEPAAACAFSPPVLVGSFELWGVAAVGTHESSPACWSTIEQGESFVRRVSRTTSCCSSWGISTFRWTAVVPACTSGAGVRSVWFRVALRYKC
jgi:hypothetical protein